MKVDQLVVLIAVGTLLMGICVQTAPAQLSSMGKINEPDAIGNALQKCSNLPDPAVNYSTGNTVLDAFFLKEMTRLAIPGLAACIFNRDGIIWEGYYGHANVALDIPVTDSTIFNIASISKIVTGTALLRLHDQGRFDLDDDINGYLPFAVRNPNHPGVPITFRMLLAHTSSIADNWSKMPYRSGDPLVPLGMFLQDYLVPGGLLYDAAKNFSTSGPGGAFVYNQIGPSLCAYLVDRIAGMSFEQYCRDSVFAPLGMTNTAWKFLDLDTSHIARPYYRGSDAGLFSHDFYPASELKTTVRALARYFRMHMRHGELDGVRILDSSTVRSALTVQYPSLISWIWSGYFCQDTARAGLFWEKYWFEGRNTWGKNGSWPAGVSAFAHFVESAGIGAIWFTNTNLPTASGNGFDYYTLGDRLFRAGGVSGTSTSIHWSLSDSLYAVSTSLVTLDPITVQPTTKGPLFVGPFNGLAVHPGTKELYGTKPVDGGTEFRRISASDGASLHVTNTLAAGLYGFAFASAEALYAVAPLAAAGGMLYRISLTTGDATLLKTYSSARFYGLAIDPSGACLWASGRTLRGTDCIYKIDPETGDTTFVGKTGNEVVTSSLAFLNGRLLGTATLGGATSIVSIEKSTGQSTFVGSTGVLGITAIAGCDGGTNVVEATVPTQFSLYQNFPNPFNPSTTITFALAKAEKVQLSVYDLLGREVSVLVNARMSAGTHGTVFDASRLPSGVYLYRLIAGEFCQTKRLIVLK